MRRVVEVTGRRLSLSNLEKDLYPSCGFTKAHVLEYYRRISRFILSPPIGIAREDKLPAGNLHE